MALYRVNDDGRAPSGLGVGDEVVTAGGTYRIDSVGADGQYKSTLVNKGQTTQNYKGGYSTRNTLPGYSDYTAGRLGNLERGYSPSGAVSQAKAYLQQVQSRRPGAYQSRWDAELDSLYDQITNRKPFQYDLNQDALYQQYKELADKEHKVIFGGRLGGYKYYDMDKVIAAALEMCEKEL